MLEKAISRLRIQENPSAAGAPPRSPSEGTYSAPANAIVGGEGLADPSPTILPHCRASGLASSTPTPKLVPTHNDSSRICYAPLSIGFLTPDQRVA